jgi:hypothetical protein
MSPKTEIAKTAETVVPCPRKIFSATRQELDHMLDRFEQGQQRGRWDRPCRSVGRSKRFGFEPVQASLSPKREVQGDQLTAG